MLLGCQGETLPHRTAPPQCLQWKYVYLVILLIVVRALREIRYWQSSYTAEMWCIPRSRFMLLCHEIQQDMVLRASAGVPGSFQGDFHWEKDALMALQLMTEHLLVMFFEMTYFFHFAK